MDVLIPAPASPITARDLVVSDITRRQLGTRRRISATVTWSGKQTELYYASDRTDICPRPEAFVSAMLVHAMAYGETLHVAGPVSPKFRDALATIQDIFLSWAPGLKRVRLSTEAGADLPAATTTRTRVAAFFSGGVDSFYTLLKHQHEIDVLVFVHGFDVSLEDRARRAAASRRLGEVALALGKELIEIESNLREVIDQPRLTKGFHNWELLHGAALASIAHILPADIGKVYVPATHSYRQIYAWGSHPLLDPLWSTEDRFFVHDGCEATRVQKCDLLARSDVALAAVRVCWENSETTYNCGRCEKCQRTMLELLAAGALHRCVSFDSTLDPRTVARRKIVRKNIRRHYKDVLVRLQETSGNAELQRAIEKALKPPSLVRRAVRGSLKTGARLYRRVASALVRGR